MITVGDVLVELFDAFLDNWPTDVCSAFVGLVINEIRTPDGAGWWRDA